MDIPLCLVSLQTSACGADAKPNMNDSGEPMFDNMTDFAIDPGRSAVAVLLNFLNKRAHGGARATGLRRTVSVSLFDATDSHVIRSTTFTVSIRRGKDTCVKRVDMPVAYTDIDRTHTYKVSVQDVKSGVTLGESTFKLHIDSQAQMAEPEVSELDKILQEFSDSEQGLKHEEALEEDDASCYDDYLCDDDDLYMPEEESDEEEDAQPWRMATPSKATGTTEKEARQAVVPLSQLTGLTAVKEKLAMYKNVVKFNRMRLDYNLTAETLPLHAMFLGSPGTGKTTVAKNIGRILHEAGVLSRGHVVERQRAELLGPNYSAEETNTLEAIEKAQGGILFIDEAYQLYQPNDPRDPGRFVIETLMTALADESRRDWMLILAGYPDEMRRMFDLNPGLRSRIPESNIYIFNDFTEPELLEIAENYLERNNYQLSAEARQALTRRLTADYKNRDKKFGNARYVVNLLQTEVLPAMAARVVAEPYVNKDTLSVIQAADIPAPKRRTESTRPRIGFRM